MTVHFGRILRPLGEIILEQNERLVLRLGLRGKLRDQLRIHDAEQINCSIKVPAFPAKHNKPIGSGKPPFFPLAGPTQ